MPVGYSSVCNLKFDLDNDLPMNLILYLHLWSSRFSRSAPLVICVILRDKTERTTLMIGLVDWIEVRNDSELFLGVYRVDYKDQ